MTSDTHERTGSGGTVQQESIRGTSQSGEQIGTLQRPTNDFRDGLFLIHQSSNVIKGNSVMVVLDGIIHNFVFNLFHQLFTVDT